MLFQLRKYFNLTQYGFGLKLTGFVQNELIDFSCDNLLKNGILCLAYLILIWYFRN